MPEYAIEAHHLSKKYSLGEKQPYLMLRDLLANPFSKKNSTPHSFWALKDVTFSIKKGEVIGVIGKNGSGKSTLLKILSRITFPSQGTAQIRGRIASLLEVGTGFNPELSGRENIFLSGAILGMKRSEIKNKFAEIVAFSGIEEFLDTPVKRYSSGMYVRLAFAVAANLEAEVLLVDEVLAVGDIEFQNKCLKKMHDVTNNHDRSILFVSHNISAIQSLCSKCLLLHKGKLIDFGPTDSIINNYYQILGKESEYQEKSLSTRRDREGNGMVKMTDISVTNQQGEAEIKSGDKLIIKIDYQSDITYESFNVIISLLNYPYGDLLSRFRSQHSLATQRTQKKGRIICYSDSLNITPGKVQINVGFFVKGQLADYIQNAKNFDVRQSNYLGYYSSDTRQDYSLLIKHSWEHTQA